MCNSIKTTMPVMDISQVLFLRKSKITMGFFTSLLIGFLSLATLNAAFCNGGCIERERQALLKLKQDMVDPAARLASWVADDEDCCKWKGVVCDNVTSHVLELCLRTPTVDFDRAPIDQYEANKRSNLGGKISPSLLNLKHLRYLDLSNNNFGRIHIPKFFGSLRSLRLLNLSSSRFVGEVPHHLGNLSNLKYLDLSWNFGLYIENFHWLSGFSSLQYLDMTIVNLSKVSNLFPMVNTLPSLVELHLAFCELGLHVEVHPIASLNLSSLVVLDLDNNFINKFSAINWVFGCKNLIFLALSGNSLEGPFPSGLQNLTFLNYLDLSYNSINSSIPNWLNSFRLLQFLDLSYNKFDGEVSVKSIEKLCNLKSISLVGVHLSEEISSVLEIFLKCISITLESLDLSSCQLSGQLPNQLGLGDFKILRKLILSNNSISGPIPTTISELPTLKVLHLSGNKLEGSLPESFGPNLEEVDISNNFLKGVISEIHFVNFTNLKTFDASGNPLMILKVNPNWIPPFQFVKLGLSSWHLGPKFPHWLHSQKNLRVLDISNSRILDTIPSWFWELSQLDYLNISSNQIQGQLPSMLNIFNHSLDIVDFSSNNFTGPLPYVFSIAYFLDLSNNNLSGSLFPFLCHEMNDSMSMRWLNLGKNFLLGELPDCWTKWPNLEVLVLSDNKLTGEIPRSIGASPYLVSLHLQKNYLSGKIPFSLSNCTELLVLDLNENKLNGSIPLWMGHSFPNLRVLNLRSNEFWGQIPNELCSLNSLQFLDLAQNNLSGGLPSCFGNISVLLSMDNHFEKLESRYSFGYVLGYGNGLWEYFNYLENADVVIKGQKLKYDKTLYLVEIMDFSSNKLTGKIPREITNLKGLISLNLSHNLFTGRIPKDIGNMRNLQSIDFSVNKLSGSIPDSMSSLTFLAHLNLSNNQLVGRIPSGTQLQTFSESCYEGNKLCGLPLATNCSPDGNFVPDNKAGKDDDGIKIHWLFVSMTLGFIVGFWSVVSPLVINRRWRCKYYQFLDEMWWRISFSVSGWL